MKKILGIIAGLSLFLVATAAYADQTLPFWRSTSGFTYPYVSTDIVTAQTFNATSTTATSTFSGGVQAKALSITSTTATSTFSNGLNLPGNGCYAIGNRCVTSATIGASSFGNFPVYTGANTIQGTSTILSRNGFLQLEGNLETGIFDSAFDEVDVSNSAGVLIDTASGADALTMNGSGTAFTSSVFGVVANSIGETSLANIGLSAVGHITLTAVDSTGTVISSAKTTTTGTLGVSTTTTPTTLTIQGTASIYSPAASSTLYLDGALGGAVIMKDETGTGCTEIYTLAGAVLGKVATCPF